MSAIPAAPAASLSSSHSSDRPAEEAAPQQSEIAFKLTGSQAKTAHALQLNIERMIRDAGLEKIGFLTLTVGEKRGGKFVQVWDAKEASRRINNLNRRVLPLLFSRAVVVTERHKSGAIHFHIVGAMANGADIRTGFDFEAFLAAREHRKNGSGWIPFERLYRRAASRDLRKAWAFLLRTLPRYGFGRAELTPIRKTGESIAGYVAKYVKKNLGARRDEDRGKKLVRYIGWRKAHTTSNGFSWASQRSAAWRANARDLGGLVGVRDRSEMSPCFGAKWAFRISRVMNAVSGGDQAINVVGKTIRASYPLRESARRLVCREAKGKWVKRRARMDAWQPSGNFAGGFRRQTRQLGFQDLK